jgi:PAS domain S-box-containing protein
LEIETYKALFDKSPKPTLYVVSKKVALANRAAAKLFKRLSLDDPEGADFGKLWPKGTKAFGKRGLTELKALKRGEYGITLPDDSILAVETTPLSRKKPTRTVVTIEDVTARKRNEEALRESEEKLKAQYKGIPVPTYTWQRVGDDFVLVGYNDAAEAITQGNVADFVGTTAGEMYRDTPEIIEELSRCFAKKTPIEREMVYRFKSVGESKHLAVKYAFVPPDLVLVHTEDITVRKRAEEALIESAEKYRNIFEHSPAGIAIHQKGKVLFANPAMLQTLGYETMDEVDGRPVLEFVHPDYREQARRNIEIVLSRKGEMGELGETKLVCKDGSYVDVAEIAQTITYDGEPAIQAYILNNTERKRAEEELRRHRDHLEELVEERTAQLKKVNVGLEAEITEREQAEEELSKSEREKSAILENMSEYVVYTDKEMRVIWANKNVADWLESAPDDLTGRKCYEMWFGRDRVCDDCHALTVFETGKRVKCERKLSDGSIWNITCDPVRDDSGEIIGAVEVSSDVTERKQAEEELPRRRSPVLRRFTAAYTTPLLH